jgi:predicted peptidase
VALAALDLAIKEFNGDRTRLYLTGLSAGGNGTWSIAYKYPERFAALIVVCGWISELQSNTTGVLYPAIAPPAAADPFVAVAERVARVPVWMFHGEKDPRVPVEESRRMAAALKASGSDVRYTELAGVGHNAWDTAYDRADLFEWLFQQRRK